MRNKYFSELIEFIKKKKPSKQKLAMRKMRLCRKYRIKDIPTDIEVMLNADAKDVPKIRRFLLTKPTRTISGVAAVAIMTKPRKCPHGRCIMCPGGPGSSFGDVPQSYTGKEPATRRAIRNNYDAYLQVMNRLEQYIVTGHAADKVELIIMGGTFPSYPRGYQERFIAEALMAMNDFSQFFRKGQLDIEKFKKFFELPGQVFGAERIKRVQEKLLSRKRKTTLWREQIKNEKSQIRCVALCIETRPDYATAKEANEMLKLGATRVELGVQSLDDDVLKRIERGHDVDATVKATRTLKELGFKVGYHIMPGLPGAKNELRWLRQIFSYEEFKPDMLKIYPCMVLKGTKLHRQWKKGSYKPLTTKKAAELIAKFKQSIPEYCRVSRVQRDIPTYMTAAGVDRTNLRQYIEAMMKKKCRCIRCREIGKATVKKYSIKAMHYPASEGNEFFITAEHKDKLLGYCRLRFPAQQLRKEITAESALIRELHVLGQSAGIGQKGEVQHKGIGRQLMSAAEQMAKMYYKKKMVVISGIGAREYYKKLGYRKEGAYMVKGV